MIIPLAKHAKILPCLSSSGSSYAYDVSSFLLPYFLFSPIKPHTVSCFYVTATRSQFIILSLFHESFVITIGNFYFPSRFFIKTLNIVGKTVISSEPCWKQICSLMICSLFTVMRFGISPNSSSFNKCHIDFISSRF